ncbi:MAG: hypothetical protein QOF76_5347, partial [Solirubrobacteraceae bacterium]|nr:hypothetical protein [Solirubrobacteraceae bacterium]
MTSRRRVTSFVATGIAAAVVGVSASSASADQRTFVVTLVGGGTVTVTLDVPPGTPLDQLSFPGLQLPVVSVQEVTPVATATPGLDIQLTPGASPTGTETPEASPSVGPGSSPVVAASGQASQEGSRKVPTAGAVAETEDLVSAVEDQSVRTQPGAAEGRNPDGSPTTENPAFSLAVPGAAP